MCGVCFSFEFEGIDLCSVEFQCVVVIAFGFGVLVLDGSES